jgi:hypothetical protein
MGGVYNCAKRVCETDTINFFHLIKGGEWFINTHINGENLVYKDRGETIKIIEKFHLIDPVDVVEHTDPVFSLRMQSSHFHTDKYSRQYELPNTRPDVVLSSSLKFVIDHLQQGVDLETSMLQADDLRQGYPVSAEVMRNDTVLFSIDLDLEGSRPDGEPDRYRANLEKIKHVDGTLQDINQMSCILSPNQLRRLRGQMLEYGLGM